MNNQKRNQGARGVQGTWIEPFFVEPWNCSYFVLEHDSKELGNGYGQKTFQRLFSHQRHLDEDINSDKKMSIALIGLIKKHGHDEFKALEDEKIWEFICKAQSQSIALSQAEESRNITNAILACQECGLEKMVKNWCDKANAEDDIGKLARQIYEIIQSGDITKFYTIIDPPLSQLLSDPQELTRKKLKQIEQFLGWIAVSCALESEPDQFDNSNGFKVYGVDQCWSMRLLIDAGLSQSLTHVFPTNHSPKADERYAAEVENAESPNVESQVHQLLEQLDSDSVSPYDAKKPKHDSSDNESEMRKYCEGYNDNVLIPYNIGKDHRFLYSKGVFPAELKSRLQTLGLSDLRIIEMVNKSGNTLSLKVKQNKLSGWLGKSLRDIKVAADALPATEQDPSATAITIYAEQIISVGDKNNIQGSNGNV